MLNMITIDTLIGPWHVTTSHFYQRIRSPWTAAYPPPTTRKYAWCVVNMLTGKTCKIGLIKGRGVNYCDRAQDEAKRRNEEFFVKHKTDLPTFMGMHSKFDSVISLMLENTNKSLTAQQIFDRKRGF